MISFQEMILTLQQAQQLLADTSEDNKRLKLQLAHAESVNDHLEINRKEMERRIDDLTAGLDAAYQDAQRMAREREEIDNHIQAYSHTTQQQAEQINELQAFLADAHQESQEFAHVIETQTPELDRLKREVLFFSQQAFNNEERLKKELVK